MTQPADPGGVLGAQTQNLLGGGAQAKTEKSFVLLDSFAIFAALVNVLQESASLMLGEERKPDSALWPRLLRCHRRHTSQQAGGGVTSQKGKTC